MQIKRIAFFVVLLMAGFASGAVFAASNMEKVEAYLRRDYTVYVDGKKADVGPVLVYNNSSYLPVAKIGEIMGAEVNWNAKNQGIYVNPRFPGQPDPIASGNPNYTKITMVQPQGYMAAYLGKESPVLGISTSDYGTTYYRDSDIRRLGIDTSGLHLAEETRTKELYVSDKELEKVWKEKPTFNYVYDKLIVGEIDPEQLKVLEDYIEGLPDMYKAMNMKDPQFPEMDYYAVPYVYVIDVLPNNEFNILGMENSHIIRYWLKLEMNKVDKWYRKEEKITDLGSAYPQYPY